MAHRITTAVASLALVVPAGFALTTMTTAEAAGAKSYSSCDKLTKDWKNGVAKSKAAANKQVRDGNSRPAYGTKAKKVYAKNKSNLDRDKDGTACEN